MNNSLRYFSGELDKKDFFEIYQNEIFYTQNGIFEGEYSYKSIYSIKFQVDGYENYRIGSKYITLGPKQFIVVNNNQTISLLSTKNTECAISIFLDPQFINDVNNNLKLNNEKLLSNPDTNTFEDAMFCEVKHFISNDSIGRSLINIARNLRDNPTQDKFSNSFYYNVAHALLISQKDIKKQLACTNALKYSTKVELYQRMIQAKEYIHDNWNNCIKINSIAEFVNMSPYHFHRTFTSTFKTTPIKYLTTHRMSKAKELLFSGKHTISDIAIIVGYEDIYSFSKEFKKYFGFAPSYYKNSKIG